VTAIIASGFQAWKQMAAAPDLSFYLLERKATTKPDTM
jgi:hypothetical protein